MFCENCGKQNPDGVKFCESCGAALEGAAPAAANGGAKKIGLIAGAVAVVLILLAIFGVFEAGSVKALKKLNKAGLSANAKAVVDVTYSPYAELEKEDKEEIIENLKETLQDAKEERKDDKIKISYSNYKVTKKYKKNEVKKIAEYLNNNGYDTDEYKLQAVHVVKYKETVKEDGDKDTDTNEAVMIKVKGKWYIQTGLSKDFIKNSILDKD